MIYTFSRKVFQIILVLSIACTGSFVLQEETSEKTEKTEKAEEALHSSFHGKGFKRVTNPLKNKSNGHLAVRSFSSPFLENYSSITDDFNINHIYFSSYLI